MPMRCRWRLFQFRTGIEKRVPHAEADSQQVRTGTVRETVRR